MSVIYLLPCHGENNVEVTTAEAGRTIVCPCGEQVQVPTLREIRRLPRRPDTPSEQAAWSAQQGVMFSIGLILLTGSLGMIGWLIYQRMQLDTEEIVIEQAQLDAWDEEIMALEAAATLDGWNQVLSKPLSEQRTLPPFEVNRAEARAIYWKIGLFGVIAVVGIGLMVASNLFKPRASPPRKARKRPQNVT